MKKLALVLAVMVLVPTMVAPDIGLSKPKAKMKAALNKLSHCGTERWLIKTLADPDAIKVTGPQIATVNALRALPIPNGYSKYNDTSRYAPVEDTEYTVRAILVGFKEEQDRDLHVVIADPNDSSSTMIAEVPDPNCSTVKASGHASQIAKVRASFLKCFGPVPINSGLQKFSGTMIADITGVGFFDVLHGQTGVAPNGIEIHPVVRIKTVSGTCPTGYHAT